MVTVTMFDASYAKVLDLLKRGQTNQISALSASDIAGLTSTQIAALSTSAIAGLTSTQIAALSVSQVGGLTPYQMFALDRKRHV